MSSFVTQLYYLHSALTPSICTHLCLHMELIPFLSQPFSSQANLPHSGQVRMLIYPCSLCGRLLIHTETLHYNIVHWVNIEPMHPCQVTLAPVSHIRPFPPYRHISHPAQALKPWSTSLSCDFPPWACYAALGHGRVLLPLPGCHLNTLLILCGCLLGGMGLMTMIKVCPILSPLYWDVGYMLSHNGWLKPKISGL